MTDDSSYSLVLGCTKEIESVLEHRYGGSGKGLGEKSYSVKEKLGEPTLKKLLFLNTIRNRLVHDPDFILDEKTRKDFLNVSIECKRILGIQPSGNQHDQKNTHDVESDLPNEKDWTDIKTQQKIIRKKMKASIISIIIVILFFTLIIKFL